VNEVGQVVKVELYGKRCPGGDGNVEMEQEARLQS
jgi:hypothetical protein